MPNPSASSAVVESVAVTSYPTTVVATGSVTARLLWATVTPAFDNATAIVNTGRVAAVTVEMSSPAVTGYTGTHVLS
jgi:hypothetical protein